MCAHGRPLPCLDPAATELLIATAKSLERVAVVPMDVHCAHWGVHPTTLEPTSPTSHDAKGLLLPMAGHAGRCIINQFKTKAYLGSKCGVCPRMSAALTTVQVRQPSRRVHPSSASTRLTSLR